MLEVKKIVLFASAGKYMPVLFAESAEDLFSLTSSPAVNVP